MKNKILILGKIPPPTGGVTIHVFRLLKSLHKHGFFAFRFQNLAEVSILKMISAVLSHKAVHLHTSNPFLQLFIAVYCRLINRKLIITYHGNWGRYRFIKNFATGLSAWLSYLPILLNRNSLVQAKSWNKNAVLVPAYIPPLDESPLPEAVLNSLLYYRAKYKFLISTNASNLSFDKNGNEIYGISALVKKISAEPLCALIISDPSGSYKKYFTAIPEKVFFITGQHDFVSLLRLSDAFVRNTTTDGDSISIHEALSLNIPVFASDCVPRPAACRLFKNISEMNPGEELEKIIAGAVKVSEEVCPDVTDELIKLYTKLLY